ncbi:MAG: glycosyltransferase family 8 protein [Opitutales bacterium]
MNTIAFFCDQQMLPGLHVALLSLLERLDAERSGALRVVVFSDGIRDSEKQRIRETAAKVPTGGLVFEIREFTPERLEGGGDLHGNTTGYGKFYMGERLPDCERCFVLDSDIRVNLPANRMFDLFDGRHVLVADGNADRNWDKHAELYRKAGLDMTRPSFNAGVLGLDLKLWRERGCLERCKAVALEYSDWLTGSDQAIFNLAFGDDYQPIGTHYNRGLRPKEAPVTKLESAIYHFIGSPKPWDAFAKRMHPNYHVWKEVYDRTALAGRSPRRYSSFKRSRKIVKSVLREWLRKRAS